MFYNKKGFTAKHLIRITHQTLIDAGIEKEILYSAQDLADKLKVSRPYFSTLLKNIPFEEEPFFHPNPNINGKVKRKVYKGSILLDFFKNRDSHYENQPSNIHPT